MLLAVPKMLDSTAVKTRTLTHRFVARLYVTMQLCDCMHFHDYLAFPGLGDWGAPLLQQLCCWQLSPQHECMTPAIAET